MSDKRMFSKKIIESDAFFDLSFPAQTLYFHLSMNADDDGFVGNPKTIQRMTGTTIEDLNDLIKSNFIKEFKNGIIVITHWNINNCIKKDRYKPTIYATEKAELEVDENGAYAECIQNGSKVVPECIQNGSTLDTQYSIDKSSIDKGSIDESSVEEKNTRPLGKYANVYLSENELEKLKNDYPVSFQEKIDKLSEYMKMSGKSYSNHYAVIQKWASEDLKAKYGEHQPSYDIELAIQQSMNIDPTKIKKGQ